MPPPHSRPATASVRRPRAARATLAAILLSMSAVSAACSAEGGVDTEGDGVKIEGDVDTKKE